MKYVPCIVAILFATFSFLSVPAQKKGNGYAVSDTAAYNRNSFFSDSMLVFDYMDLSRKYIDKNPDSSLYWADVALDYAVRTKNFQVLNRAIRQRRFVQDYSLDKIKKQNEIFTRQNLSHSSSPTLLIFAAALLFATCVYLSVIYIRRNNSFKEVEFYYEQSKNQNKELADRVAELEMNKETTPNEDMVKVNSIKDRLIPMIAHDIRSPLASVQHMLSLARENILSPEEFQKLSYSLEADIYNLRGMLDNMLLWTREQMIEIKITKSLFNISEAVKEVILMHRNSLITKNITINNYLQPDVEVFSDKEVTTAVLRNIFSNAVKFTPQDKNIYINQIYLNKKIYISIKDEGKGMNDETIEKIKSSEHISTRGTANEKGTGIGIMFTKDLLKKIDEIFDITSMPGHGTSVTFSVSMPEQLQQN